MTRLAFAWRRPVAAVSFLTRVPAGRALPVGPDDVAAGAPLFPLVGGAVGLAAGVTADLLAGPLPPLVAGALAVGVAAVLTGAMHFDALADTADALGGRTREQALEIMRDHAVGSFGALALVLVCLVDAAVLATLADQNDAALVALGAAAAGRAAMLPQALLLPYARAGDGQGRVLAGLGGGGVAVGSALAVLLAAPSGVAGLAGLATAAVVALALGVVCRAWLGGVTGDTLGATSKLAETAFLVAALVVIA
jgi:adenosylcobinamide-GDP ribazoletransferase